MNLLEIKELTKKYGEKKVVNNITFHVKEGEILGLLGPNGAGKSTTISIITSIIKQDNGEILFMGERTESNQKRFKRNLGIVPQEISFYEDLSAYDNVKFFCSLYGFRNRELRERTKKALEFVELWERRKDTPGQFSGGMKRRLNIACSIAHSPKLLIMDEPTVGIDPQSRNHIMKAIQSLNQQGTTVIYVSHYMEEIENLCRRIIVLDHGQVIEDIEKEKLKEKYKEKELYNLEDIFLHLTGTELRDKEE